MASTGRPRSSGRDKETQREAQAPSSLMGIILVVVAVALGVILLTKGGGVSFDEDSKNVAIGKDDKTQPVETTTTLAPEPSTSVPAAELKVAVLNGSGKNGFAGMGASFLSVAGYPTVTAGNSAKPAEVSAVYYAPGFEADAKAVAKLFSIGAVSEMPSTPLGRAATDTPEGTAVVVVLGLDVEPLISQNATATTDASGSPTTTSGSQTTTSSVGN